MSTAPHHHVRRKALKEEEEAAANPSYIMNGNTSQSGKFDNMSTLSVLTDGGGGVSSKDFQQQHQHPVVDDDDDKPKRVSFSVDQVPEDEEQQPSGDESSGLIPPEEFHMEEGVSSPSSTPERQSRINASTTTKYPDRRTSEFRLEKSLTEDIYSVMYICHRCSYAFFFAWAVFIVQFTILVLIFGDLVDITQDPFKVSNGTTNRLKIPAGVGGHVRFAQFLGVILTVNFTAAGGDLFKGLQHLFNGFDYLVEREHPGANRRKWFVSGLLQIVVGILMIVDLFILSMQATNVIGMCLNFAALHFVQEIDDTAYTVASMGLLGLTIQKEVKAVGEIMIFAGVRKRTTWMRRGVYIVLVTGLYICWFIIASWQWTGVFQCDVILVQFGDTYAPDMAFYSGPFRVDGSQHNRPVYVDESESIKLRYSATNKAWVFEPNIDEKGHVIIMSSETTDFDVTTIADSTWYHNTTAGFVPVDWLAFRCNECSEDRCPLDRGTCNDKHVCVCHDEFIGENCESPAPKCRFYGIDARTSSTLSNIPRGSFFFEYEFSALSFGRFYGRYVYVPYNLVAEEGYDRKVDSLMFFTGRRWMIMGPEFDAGEETYDSFPTLESFIGTFNATLVQDIPPSEALKSLAESEVFRPLYFSTPVDLGTPTYGYDPSTVTWVFAVEQEHSKESEFFGFEPNDGDTLNVQLLCAECSNNTDDGTANCQNGGQCDGYGYCKCLPFYAGYQCEYIFDCNELRCFNGGKCDAVTGHCQKCFHGAYGNLCQFPLPAKVAENPYFCSTTYDFLSTCQNGQKCNSFELTCECEPPFYGEFCQNSTQADCLANAPTDDEDASFVDPCQNGGYCDISIHHSICRCPNGFTGDYCEKATNSSGGEVGR